MSDFEDFEGSESQPDDNHSWLKLLLREFLTIKVDEDEFVDDDVKDHNQCLVPLWQCVSHVAEYGIRYVNTSEHILR